MALITALALAAVGTAALARTEGSGRPGMSVASPLRILVADADRPSPQRAASGTPLGTPRLAPPGSPAHAFLTVQRDGATPVAYDPCRPIRYVVNARTAPPGAAELLDAALAAISDVTGLQFSFDGETDEPPSTSRDPFQPERYGDRWAPVLVAWSDPAELPVLGGDIAGVGGSAAVEAGSRGLLVYVSGMVALDGPQLTEALGGGGGQAIVRGVVLHELSHLLGLDHVDDPGQLLHERSAVTDLRAGDVKGLVALGAGACLPEL